MVYIFHKMIQFVEEILAKNGILFRNMIIWMQSIAENICIEDMF